MSHAGTWASELIARLAAASLQSLLLVALVWAACRWLPGLSAAARCRLWWLTALQLLIGLCWPTPLALSAPAWWPSLAIGQTLPAAAPWSARVPFALAAGAAVPAAPDVGAALPAWSLALASLWLAGCVAMSAVQLRAWRSVRRRLAASQPCEHAGVAHLWRRLGVALGLRRMPALRVSAQIESPQLLGPWPATVLLPQARLATMSEAELEMALHHELEHLRRGDLWWGWVPAAAQWLFFFHPLAHLIAREYALAREAAVDAAVLDSRRYPAQDYGRLLLRLGVGPRPQAGLASASPTYLILKRRLTMLHNAAPTSRLLALCLTAAIAAFGLAPYRIAAADIAQPVQAKADPDRAGENAGETRITERGAGVPDQRWAVRGERYYRIGDDGAYREVVDPATRERLQRMMRESRQAEIAGERARREAAVAASEAERHARAARIEGERAAEHGRREAEQGRRVAERAQAMARRHAAQAEQQAHRTAREQATAERAAEQARREGPRAQAMATREAARAERQARQAARGQVEAERIAEQARRAAAQALREAAAATREAEQAAREAAQATREISREG
ncbi:M56 family metallopeptidase [Lysobacter firmicutimachus]|uniref:M56 family metallopeptidase n=1 Tax=Lysobacter firmicutimachus TaxID=1792846 RepID=A0AAU8MNW5_9GAMM